MVVSPHNVHSVGVEPLIITNLTCRGGALTINPQGMRNSTRLDTRTQQSTRDGETSDNYDEAGLSTALLHLVTRS